MSFEPIINFLKDHFWAEVALRFVLVAVPVAGSLLAGLIMVFFLMHRMGSAHFSGLSFSTKGLGRSAPADTLLTQELPSLSMSLFLTVLLGGFGLFYLSILAGFTMSILSILALLLLLVSIKVCISVEGILWGVSVATAYWLWKKRSHEMWYRVNN